MQCTCAAMIASNPYSTVALVASTTSDKLDPNYDVGLPAGTQVCFVAMYGAVTPPAPPLGAGAPPSGSGAITYAYSFEIFTESPWWLTEVGTAGQMQPTPGSDK
jgi:hypothetical protein